MSSASGPWQQLSRAPLHAAQIGDRTGLIVPLLRMEKPLLTGSWATSELAGSFACGAAHIAWFAYRARMSAVAPVSSLRAAYANHRASNIIVLSTQ